MRTSKTMPEWAVELTHQVCKDYKRVLPTKVQWYNRKNQAWSYGTTWRNGKIHVSAGFDEDDQKLLLLHELAHHIINKTKRGRKQGHTMKFWRLAFRLYGQYGVDLEFAHTREKGYRQKAVWAYQEVLAKK